MDKKLQVLQGVNNCTLLLDPSSFGLDSLEEALTLADSYSHNKAKTLIISTAHPFLFTRTAEFVEVLRTFNVGYMIAIGPGVLSDQYTMTVDHYSSKEVFLADSPKSLFLNEVIIIKGEENYRLDLISKRLQKNDQQTVLKVNLDAFTHNYNYYKSLISPNTKVMAMVKAFSYGSGAYEVASHLESIGVDYLAVAQTDQGAELRQNGVQLPILILNPEPSAFSAIVRHNLQPEIYSLELLSQFIAYLTKTGRENYPIQLKLDTGMHRLGMEKSDLEKLLFLLSKSNSVKIEAIFSHLAAAGSHDQDDFTKGQIALFKANAETINRSLNYTPLQHICNSIAISRFPETQMDMVRLGISLYGISSDEDAQKNLQLVSRLKTTIIQTRTLKAGDTLGYGRTYKAAQTTEIAIIPIGYADGLFRALGNGKFHAKIGNQKAKIIGTICMDMCFLDITHCNAKTGDEVEIFSTAGDVKQMAEIINSIPYEILTSISERVKREYYAG